jgi:hypothetical protein
MTEQCLSTRKPLYAGGVAASDITSGQVALARGGTASDLSATGPGFLYQASGGAVVTIIGASVSATELGYLDGVTSAIQTQIDAKQATITGGATTITSSDLTADRALISSGTGKVAVSTVTATEVGLLSGVTGVIVTEAGTQTLTNKTLTSPTMTGPILGTPASGTLTNCTGLPIAGLVASTSTAIGVGSIELGHASDTTITRVSAGVIAVEGVNLVAETWAQTLTNKTLGTFKINSAITDTSSYVLIDTTGGGDTNYLMISNADAAAAPKIASTGGDTNVDLELDTKGTGVISCLSTLKEKATYSDKETATDGATVTFDCSVSDTHYVLIQDNRTLALSNTIVGQWFKVIIQQDGAGSRTVTWWSTINWAGGSAPTLTTTPNKCDVFNFYHFSSGVFMGFIKGQNITN